MTLKRHPDNEDWLVAMDPEDFIGFDVLSVTMMDQLPNALVIIQSKKSHRVLTVVCPKGVAPVGEIKPKRKS